MRAPHIDLQRIQQMRLHSKELGHTSQLLSMRASANHALLRQSLRQLAHSDMATLVVELGQQKGGMAAGTQRAPPMLRTRASRQALQLGDQRWWRDWLFGVLIIWSPGESRPSWAFRQGYEQSDERG